MKKIIKIISLILLGIILMIVIDLMCIVSINRPLFAIKSKYGNIYRGLFYDTYNCMEYSMPQIKQKGLKLACAIDRLNIGKVVGIKDNAIVCASSLEEFYQDDNYIYYWNCIKSYEIIVKYESGYTEMVNDALKYKSITISDLDKFGIEYIKKKKQEN